MAVDKTLKVAAVGLSVGHAGSIGPERPSLIHNFSPHFPDQPRGCVVIR